MTFVKRIGSLQEIAAALVRDEPALLSSLDFGPFVRQGIGPGPSVWIGDQVGIPLLSPERVGKHDHRLAPLAVEGDIVVVRTRDPAFEAYLADHLGIRGVTFLEADATGLSPVAEQCRSTPRLLEPLATALRDHGSMTLQPFVSNGHAWRLAADLGALAGSTVHVAGPGPRAMRRSNDKLWFWALARKIVGAGSVPPTWAAYGPSGAAGHVAHLIRRYGQAVVKVPDSAGAAGNLRIDPEKLPSCSISAIRTFLLHQLAALGWDETYPVLVGVWESGVTQSPSAQVWIPAPEDGPPAVLAVSEQAVEGETGAFVGARPARLPPVLHSRIIDEAVAIGTVLQRIGYFGPCSFDAVLRDGRDGTAEVHWIECNGRWSGVSIPLAAVERLRQGQSAGGIVIFQDKLVAPHITGTAGLCAALGDLLYRDGDAEGLMILSPPPDDDYLVFNAVALAESQPRAEDIAQAALSRLGSRAQSP